MMDGMMNGMCGGGMMGCGLLMILWALLLLLVIAAVVVGMIFGHRARRGLSARERHD